MPVAETPNPDDKDAFVREPYFLKSDEPQVNWELDVLEEARKKWAMAQALRSGQAREVLRPRSRLARFIVQNIIGEDSHQASLSDLLQARKLEAQIEEPLQIATNEVITEANFWLQRYGLSN